ncbi:fimbrial biogenesis chaperone [Enterobacter hormaechei]|uniref:fimbrial biogenesis chaperone n=1 Tax=Enterobacter hormaechei TaxID=158836 RepID=UPI002175C7F7|nr:molecular chaperone [Enterobacter hormaechei]UVZ93284.1 molecular chaperone [Enterobacter hormaechei]
MSERDKEVTFSVINTGDQPALIQLWIDNDQIHERPEKINTPFVILPPIFKVGSNETRTVLVKRIDSSEGVTPNSELLYWLNVLEIPPKVTKFDNRNEMQMAIRTRVKLFFRPSLAEDYTTDQSIEKLTYEIITRNGDKLLRLLNKSPIHVTLLKVRTDSGIIYDSLQNDGLINPFSFIDISLKNDETINSFEIYWVDDFGVIKVTKNDFIEHAP